MNFTTIKKATLGLAAALVMSFVAFAQTGSAADLTETYSPPMSDVTVSFVNNWMGDYNANSILPSNSPLISINTTPYAQLISFVDFNLSASTLKGLTLKSASLSLYGFGQGMLDAYYVSNDAWVNAPTNGISIESLIGSAAPVATFDMDALSNGVGGEQPYIVDLSSLTKLSADLNNPTDEKFSLALVARNVGDNDVIRQSEFRPGEGRAAALTITATPAPEPSSMIFGAMGLSSLLGLRKKRVNA